MIRNDQLQSSSTARPSHGSVLYAKNDIKKINKKLCCTYKHAINVSYLFINSCLMRTKMCAKSMQAQNMKAGVI